MPAIQMGTAAKRTGVATSWLSLADAMAEANSETVASVEGESRVPLKRLARPSVTESGIRYQRCGGGRRVIRRQKGGAY